MCVRVDYCMRSVFINSIFSFLGGGGVKRVDLAVGKITLWDKFIMFADGFVYRYSGSKRDFWTVLLKLPETPRCASRSCSAMKLPFRREFILESIELFIEELAPHPPPPLLFRQESGLFLSLPVCRRSSLLTGDGVGEEPNHTTARKRWSFINLQYSSVAMMHMLYPSGGISNITVLYKLHKLTPVIFYRICLKERCSFP